MHKHLGTQSVLSQAGFQQSFPQRILGGLGLCSQLFLGSPQALGKVLGHFLSFTVGPCAEEGPTDHLGPERWKMALRAQPGKDSLTTLPGIFSV